MSLEAVQRNGHNLFLPECVSTGLYDTPVLAPVQSPDVLDWIAFNRAATDKQREKHGVHFYIDDYLFERVWHDPHRYAKLLAEFPAIMTPDFSLFTDYPRAVQIYNHYRKHRLGAYWQSLGMTVIPSICWSDEDSLNWCFDGEPVGGCVSVSSVGTQKNPAARNLFLMGYREMMSQLQPEKIIFFGDVPAGCDGNIEQHPAFYHTVHARRKAR
ncbi:MAG: DUF4417 domain-containing protein [Ruminococcaceae bacterium]|nr:DUF4417 domain-containing protein [Oscillospiraceae bacterium]